MRDDLLIVSDTAETRLVMIGHDHYPGSSIALRIDTNKPFVETSDGFADSRARDVLAALTSGRSAVTRYQRWPYQTDIDARLSLEGFPQAVQLLNWSVKHYR
jgi:hypothetical protein